MPLIDVYKIRLSIIFSPSLVSCLSYYYIYYYYYLQKAGFVRAYRKAVGPSMGYSLYVRTKQEKLCRTRSP